MGALSKLKILDFSTHFPGMSASMYFADMGADVIRISSKSKTIDEYAKRRASVPGTDLDALSAMLLRNKKSLSLNLKCSEAKDVVYRLIEEYDILLEAFRPGVMDRLGLGYEELSRYNPRLIYCSLTAYGQTGPLSKQPGHDINFLARSGISSYSGRLSSGPSLQGIQVGDLAGGTANVIAGILTAVIERYTSGKGQHIDVSMLDGCIALTSGKASQFLIDGKLPEPESERTNGGCLYDFYKTRDGKYITVGSLEQKFFAAFCTTIGLPELIPGTIAPDNLAEVKKEVAKIIAGKTRDEWVEIFSPQGICVEPVLNFSEVLMEDAHIQERECVVLVPGGNGIAVPQLASPIRYSRTPAEYRHIGVPTGKDSVPILQKLGYTAEKIKEFESSGVLS